MYMHGREFSICHYAQGDVHLSGGDGVVAGHRMDICSVVAGVGSGCVTAAAVEGRNCGRREEDQNGIGKGEEGGLRMLGTV